MTIKQNSAQRLLLVAVLILALLMPLGAALSDAQAPTETDESAFIGEPDESEFIGEPAEPDESEFIGEPAAPDPGDSIGVEPEQSDEPIALYGSDLEGASCVLIDRDSGEVLFEKASNARRFPASTTKIMTLLLAVEHGRLDEIVDVPQEVRNVPSGSSLTSSASPLLPGERMPLNALLHGLMLPSGNDAAIAVAVIIGGSEAEFVNMMNERADQIGCEDTHFANPHGFHDINHYTTAMDMAKIAAEGMKNSAFRSIVGSLYFTMPATLYRANAYDIENHNQMLYGSSEYYYSEMDGIKTGYHEQAGQCFVGSATHDGANLVSVTFKTSNEGRWTDTRKLMEYGFSLYKRMPFAQLYETNPITVHIEGAVPPQGDALPLLIQPGGTLDDYSVRIGTGDGLEQLQLIVENSELRIDSPLNAPIAKGAPIATLIAKYADGRTRESTLVAGADVEAIPEIEPEPATEIAAESGQADAPQPIAPAQPLEPGIMRLLVIAGIVLIALLAVVLVVANIRKKRERERRRMAALRRKKRAMEQQRRSGRAAPAQRKRR